MFIKFLKYFIGTFCLIECIGFLIMLFQNLNSQFFPWFFGTVLFGFLSYLCFKKPKQKLLVERKSLNEPITSSIFPSETLNEIRTYYPKENIPVLIKQIEESIYLVETTNNVETLLSRREDLFQKCYTLKELEDCGLYKSKPCSNEFICRFSNLNVHLKRCYNNYSKKAEQLKTESGRQRRMDEFWSILNKYLDEFTIKDFKESL